MAAGVSFGGRFRLRRTSIRGLMGLTALVAFSVWLPLEGWPSLRRCLRYREMAAAWERESAATRVIAEAVDRRRVEPPQGGRRPDTPCSTRVCASWIGRKPSISSMSRV